MLKGGFLIHFSWIAMQNNPEKLFISCVLQEALPHLMLGIMTENDQMMNSVENGVDVLHLVAVVA